MQGSIRELVVNQNAKIIHLEYLLQKEQQKKQYVTTSLFDARYTIKQQKQLLDKYARNNTRYRTKLSTLRKINVIWCKMRSIWVNINNY